MRDRLNRTASEMWMLGLSAIVTQMESEDILNHCEVGGFPHTEKKISWGKWVIDHLYGVKSRDDLLEWNESLRTDGYTQVLQDELVKLPADSSGDNYRMRLLRDNADVIRRCGAVGWDYGRLACITGWAALAGYISDEEYWQMIIPIAHHVQSTYQSWHEYAEGYQLGRAYWSQGAEHEPTSSAIKELFSNPNSPWLKYDWNTPLEKPSLQKSFSSQNAADPEIFPGQPISRLSEYAKLMRMIQAGQMNEAMSACGLDMMSYAQAMQRWGQKMATDPALAMRFSQLLTEA